jgi:hypothetical protein
MGPPLSERPSVPTESQRLAAKEADRVARDIKQAARGRRVAAERLREYRRATEEQRLEEKAAQTQSQKERLERYKAEMDQRRKLADILVQYEMFDKDTLGDFITRLSTSVEKIPAEGVPLAQHLQEAKTSVDQGRRFDGLVQKELVKLKNELGSVLEKPQEQIRLENALPVIRMMIKEANFKVQRLEKYMEQLHGNEPQLREADARLLQNAQKTTKPEDFVWVNLVKELKLSEIEKKTARAELHTITSAAIRRLKAAQRQPAKAPASTPKEEQTEGEPASTEPQISEEPEKAPELVEEPKKKGGMFGWFGP